VRPDEAAFLVDAVLARPDEAAFFVAFFSGM